MELEGGMPTESALEDMTDKEYAAYEKKYLTPTAVVKDELLMQEPKLISELTKAERKKIGRSVLNATLKNAPAGTKISGAGDIILQDGSIMSPTHHGRGKNAEYDFIPPEGYEVVEPVKTENDLLNGKRITDQEQADMTLEEINAAKDRRAYDRFKEYESSNEVVVPDDVGSRVLPEGQEFDPLSFEWYKRFCCRWSWKYG